MPFALHVAVIVVSPVATPFTVAVLSLPETVAIDVSELVHVISPDILLNVAFSVPVFVLSSAIFNFYVTLSKSIPVVSFISPQLIPALSSVVSTVPITLYPPFVIVILPASLSYTILQP